jgi:serine/threonine protein kinase
MSISALTDFSGNDQALGLHADLCYDDVVAAGSAARPLDFPAPTVIRCITTDVHASDHRSGTIHFLRNVIMRADHPDTAYFVTKKLGKTVYGSIRLCIVLKRRTPGLDRDHPEARQDTNSAKAAPTVVEWESTDLQAAVKISEFSKIHAMRGRHLEDPIKEISAMQLLGNYHPHVLGAMDVLQDDNYLYIITRHLPGGELYGRLQDAFPKKIPQDELDEGPSSTFAYDESKARTWFKQLILALDHYHKKGVSHQDVSLENIVLDENDRVVLVDPGLSLRVPHCGAYLLGRITGHAFCEIDTRPLTKLASTFTSFISADPCNPDCVSDVSAGTSRRLMIAQGQGGKIMYAAPEVMEKKAAVDAYAVDLWAAGVVGFVMLVGLAPFKWAHSTDKRFAQISRGGLSELLTALDIPLSPEAVDLLQGFFWKDPRQRWTLAEILDHPWVQGKRFKNVSFVRKTVPEGRFAFARLGSKKRLTKACDGILQKYPPSSRMVVPNGAYYC